MSHAIARLLRIPATTIVVAIALIVLVPYAMSLYSPYFVRPGIDCIRVGRVAAPPYPLGVCKPLADLYHLSFVDLFVESMFRSLALLVGAAALALVLGAIRSALFRRDAAGDPRGSCEGSSCQSELPFRLACLRPGAASDQP